MGNNLNTLDVSKNTALRILWVGRNPISELDLSKNTALNDLACQECELTKLDLTKNTSLHVVTCYKNNISGANMTALVTSLHSGIGGSIVLKSTSTDANKALVSDVAIATAKKWKVFYSDYTEYSGE